MKKFSFDIASWELDSYFRPVREKRDIVLILMRVLKTLSTPVEIAPMHRGGRIVLVIDRMSRLFIVGDSKIFSIRFPFFIRESEDSLIASTLSAGDLDSKITSEVIAVFSDPEVFASRDLSDFCLAVEELAGASPNIWPLILDMLMFEDGYLRFDHDPANANGRLHPLFHYDFFYTQACVLKIGVHLEHGLDEIIDLLDTRTDCLFVS